MSGSSPAATDGGRAARIDRLTERLALMQSDLGGLFYEMAIRDHLQLDLLVERAAAMQRVEEELRALRGQTDGAGSPSEARKVT